MEPLVKLSEGWMGQNRRVAPSKLGETESPDCMNCDHKDGEVGLLGNRLGRSKVNVTAYGANVVGFYNFEFFGGSRLMVATADGQITDDPGIFTTGVSWPGSSYVAVTSGKIYSTSFAGQSWDHQGIGASQPVTKTFAAPVSIGNGLLMCCQMPGGENSKGDFSIVFEAIIDGAAHAAGSLVVDAGCTGKATTTWSLIPVSLHSSMTGLKATIINDSGVADARLEIYSATVYFAKTDEALEAH